MSCSVVCRLICQLIAEHKSENAPHEKLIKFGKDRHSRDWRYTIDATKMSDALGWQPADTFEPGIRKTTEWYLSK